MIKDEESNNKKDKKRGQARSEEEEKTQKKKKEIYVEDIIQNHTFNRVRFEVKILSEFVDKFKNDPEFFEKTFNLNFSISLKNMVLFDKNGII